MGLRLEFYNGKQSAGLIYRLSEKYTLDNPLHRAKRLTMMANQVLGFSIIEKLK